MRKLIYVYAIGMRRLNDRLLSFLGPFKFCFITALAAIVYRRPIATKIYQILVRARKFEWCHYLQEIFSYRCAFGGKFQYDVEVNLRVTGREL